MKTINQELKTFFYQDTKLRTATATSKGNGNVNGEVTVIIPFFRAETVAIMPRRKPQCNLLEIQILIVHFFSLPNFCFTQTNKISTSLFLE
jgi:hypothetical protein